jgi:hypothetical protein
MENQMKGLMSLVLVAFISQSAFAQMQHGTIAVTYFSKENDKIIIAADSRVIYDGGVLPSDSACKIVAPHGRIIFVSANFAGYSGDGNQVQPWSNMEEIGSAYDRASLRFPGGTQQLIATASEWSESIKAHFQSLLQWHPERVVQAAKDGDGFLTKAFIGGVGDDGKMLLLKTEISFEEGAVGGLHYRGSTVSCPNNSFCPLGRIEIAMEFANQTSRRAKLEAKRWRPPKGAKPDDYDILRTMRLVELTKKYYKGSDVGGPIDAVEMDRDGGVRWFALKPNCKKD